MFARVFFLIVFLTVTSKKVYACAVCFGDPNDPSSKGVAAGVLLLMGVVGSVLVAIAATAFHWSKRAKQMTASRDLRGGD